MVVFLVEIKKVKKLEIGWCIPHEMAADNAEGGSGQPPSPGVIGLSKRKTPENNGNY